MSDTAIWIQAPGEVLPHQFSLFRKRFRLNADAAVRLRISADTNFVAEIDGCEVMRGQFSDYPEHKTYSEVEFPLEKGEHTLLIDHYYCGTEFFTYIAGQPGLWAELESPEFHIVSDTGWEVKHNPAYLRDRIDMVTNQLGYVVGFDARQEERENGFVPAVESSRTGTPVPRPLPLLKNLPPVAGKVVRQGFLHRASGDGTYAEVVDRDRYDDARQPDSNGIFGVCDLGDEYAGLIELECELPAGTVVDISHGEHITGGRVRNWVGGRNFTDRFIADGRNRRYVMPRRIGGRFLQLNVVAPESVPAELPRVALRPVEVELPESAAAPCSDPFALRLLKHAERTLRLCMHEHYEDTPWREQCLYAYDSRNQMLFGYYLWGNYEFARVSLKLLGDGISEDGFIPLTAPTRLGPPIACFSLVYVVALYEHWLYSGEKTAFEENRAAVFKVVENVLSGYDAELGLYWTPKVKNVWHFYEWNEGLNGCTPGRGLGEDGDVPRLEAPYNLHVLEMFDALYALTGDEKWRNRASELRRSVFEVFWDAEQNALRTRRNETRLHELVQALGLFTRAIPEGHRARTISGIMSGKFLPVSLSPMLYLFRALRDESAEVRQYLEERLRREFGPMLTPSSTTLWETALGEADFDNAGSMCHGWSALPVYWYYRDAGAVTSRRNA